MMEERLVPYEAMEKSGIKERNKEGGLARDPR
jgi:hypothetical protein